MGTIPANQFQTQTPFIGYADLDEMIETALRPLNEIRRFYALLIVEPSQANKYGMAIETTRAVIEHFDGSVVRYWQFKLGAVQTINGQPMSKEHADKSHDRAEAAFALIINHLKLRECGIDRALIARPKDFTYLDGNTPGLLRYEREQDRFVIVEKERGVSTEAA